MINFEGIVRDVVVNSTLFKVCVGYALISILGDVAMRHNVKSDHNNKKLFKIVKAENVEPKSYDIDYEKIENSKYKKELSEVVLFLTRHCSKETLVNFYNNFNDVVIKRSVFSVLLGAAGRYDTEDNKVFFVFRKSLIHELLHLASTFYDKETGLCRSGFLQCKYNVNGEYKPLRWIGNGINEGYTDYLTRKYFPSNLKNRASYSFEINIATKIEQVVGDEKMEDLFFKADLNGLVNELSKYASKDEVIKFIRAVDMVNNHGRDFFFVKNKLLQKDIWYIYSFLVKLYRNKLRKDLDDGIISQEMYCTRLRLFINSIETNIKFGLTKYNTFEEEKPKEKVLKVA